MSRIDEAAGVREGEELAADALSEFLQAHVEGVSGPFDVKQFKRGHSNLTYLVVDASGRELVVRRAPPGVKIKSAHDMGREFRILNGLSRVWSKVPRPLALCEDESVLGSPFYVMERLRGAILRNAGQGAELGLDEKHMRTLATSLVDTLAEIHALDVEKAELSDLGKPEGYVARQITGWSQRYQKAKTDEIAQMDRLAAWLDENQPGEVGACLIHNDYKYDNVVLDPDDPTRIIGVLDWEMATVGDPLMDLGTTLGYWVDPDDPPALRQLELGATTLSGNLTRVEVAARYAQRSGRDVDDILFYYVYALFKVCVIAQQIYARFAAGLSKDPRFAHMIDAVRLLAGHGVRAVEAGRIDRLG